MMSLFDFIRRRVVTHNRSFRRYFCLGLISFIQKVFLSWFNLLKVIGRKQIVATYLFPLRLCQFCLFFMGPSVVFLLGVEDDRDGDFSGNSIRLVHLC